MLMVNPPPVIIDTHTELHGALADWYAAWGTYAIELGRYHYAKKHAADDAVIPPPEKPEGLTIHPMIQE